MTPYSYRSQCDGYLLRILLVALFMVSVPHPAFAGPQERANSLFVEAAKLIQAAINEPDVEVRLEKLMEAQENFQQIIEEFPSSNLAVKLISGQSIGNYSLDGVRDAVEWANVVAQAERARIAAIQADERSREAATKAEELLSKLTEIQSFEEGMPIAEEILALIGQLETRYGATNFLSNLRSRYGAQYEISINTWASIALKPIELLLTRLEKTRSTEEAEPLINTIGENLKDHSNSYWSSSYYKRLWRRFKSMQTTLPEKWAAPWAESVLDLITELKATKTAEEGAPIISEIRIKFDQLSTMLRATRIFSSVHSNFQLMLENQLNTWSNLEIGTVDKLIKKLANSKGIEGRTKIVEAINQLVVKYGWTRSMVRLRTRYERVFGKSSNHGIIPQN